MIRVLIAAGLAMGPSLAVSTGTARPKLAEPPVMDGCDGSDLGFMVGRPLDGSLEERAREESGSKIVRVIRPGEAAAQDLRPERLNLVLDAQGKVIAVRCG